MENPTPQHEEEKPVDAEARAAARERLRHAFHVQKERSLREGIGAEEADDAVDDAMSHVRRASS